MERKTEKKQDLILKRQRRLLLISVGLFVLVFISSQAAFKMYHNMKETEATRVRVEAAVAELGKREEHLKQEVKRMNTSQGLDEEIRERYGVKKPGEGVIILLDEGKEPETSEVKKRSFGSTILHFFGAE